MQFELYITKIKLYCGNDIPSQRFATNDAYLSFVENYKNRYGDNHAQN